MTSGLLGFLGGIGLFLFGMETMTAALRALAGEGLRQWLLRMTSTPLRGVLTGAGITAAVQSSTAVNVMTIGFVGAGLIGIRQSLGVIYGANIGTTVTGWIIMLVGVKLKLGVIALPALFLAAMMGIMTSGRIARAGRVLGGLSLMFIGLDMTQAATAGLGGMLSPDWLPGDSWAGRLGLAVIGFVLVAILHSSSAGIAMTLVLLGSGTLSLAQAAALMIGMNLGTTLTGVLAGLGGGRAMLRASLADLLFNLGTALMFFPVLGGLATLFSGLGIDDQTGLVLMHSLVNLAGTAVFLPFTRAFAALLVWLVPDRPVTLAAALDPRLLSEPGTALDAATRTALAITADIGRSLQAALAPGATRDRHALETLRLRVHPALKALETWLTRLSLPADQTAALDRMAALMHLTDHLERLAARAAEHDRIALVGDNPRLSRPGRAIAAALAQPPNPGQAARLAARTRSFALRHRRGALLREHAGLIAPAEVFRETDALRWLDRVSEHAERIAHYAVRAEGGPPGTA